MLVFPNEIRARTNWWSPLVSEFSTSYNNKVGGEASLLFLRVDAFVVHSDSTTVDTEFCTVLYLNVQL